MENKKQCFQFKFDANNRYQKSLYRLMATEISMEYVIGTTISVLQTMSDLNNQLIKLINMMTLIDYLQV